MSGQPNPTDKINYKHGSVEETKLRDQEIIASLNGRDLLARHEETTKK